MKVREIHQFLKEKGTWVNWPLSCDRILWGDPETEVTGIAVAWMSTLKNLRVAAEAGCNLFICHEPLYAAKANKFDIYIGGSVHDAVDEMRGVPVDDDDVWVKKAQWLDQHQMVVMRCHDVWDDFPEIGIHGAWAKWLGFANKPIAQRKFYEVHDLGDISFGELAEQVRKKVLPLGQPVVLKVGDPATRVHRVAVGTGAITDYRIMHYELGADALILTDDGTRLWESAQWAEDSGIPLLIVNHATAEEPGMQTLANYLKEQYPSLVITQIARGCLYHV
jgi:putative NIF3 family GTP cyclohydrolase 1 type 2